MRAKRYDAMRYLVIACTGFCSLETRREVPSEIRGHSCLNKMKKKREREAAVVVGERAKEEREEKKEEVARGDKENKE